MKTCLACTRTHAASFAVCPFCGHREDGKPAPFAGRASGLGGADAPFRGGGAPLASPAPSFQAAGGAPLLDARIGAVAPMPRWLHGLLLALSLPVLGPSLLLLWLMAKRWGRVPLGMILFDGVLFLGASARTPFWFAANVAACAALLALYLRRSYEGRASGGVVLGYSGAVAAAMIAGSVLSIAGLLMGAPGIVASRLEDQKPRDATTTDILDERLATPKRVRIRDAALEAGPGANRIRSAEMWRPVARTRRAIWVASAQGEPALENPPDGVLLVISPEEHERFATSGLPVVDGAAEPRFVVVTPTAYRARAQERPTTRPRFLWMLPVGVLLLALAVARGVTEDDD